MSKKHDEDKPKKRSKEEQEAMSKYLTEKFAELAKDRELLPVILDRGAWEMIKWSIEQALKLKHKEKK
jgi:hypothetical protein